MSEASGKEHPLSILMNEAYQVFTDLGFEIATGPELESEWYNFDVLNVPKDHPARDMQDTFWIKEKEGNVLRTHTTATIARAMELAGKEGRIPAAFISVGKVFRNEATDAAHEHTFYQLEGVVVDKDISIAHLVAVMKTLLKGVLKRDVEVRLRPGHFQFVEPGFELDIKCLKKQKKLMETNFFVALTLGMILMD